MTREKKTRFASFLAGAAALAGCTSILGSFDTARETTSPDSDGAASDSATTSPDGGGGDDGSAPGDASTSDGSTPLSCTAPEVICGTGSSAVCANRDTSGAHCGTCGHSCGGGPCTQGKCGVAKLYEGTAAVGPLAISDVDIFFESDESPSYKLLACSKAGCQAAPRQVAVMPFSINAIDVPTPDTVVFISAPQNGSGTERPAIFSCPTAACPALPVSFTADGLNGFDSRLRSQAGTVYALSGGSGLLWSACDAGACATPANHFGAATKGTHGFYPGVSNLFFIDATVRGSPIAKCLLGDTACTPAALVTGDQSLVEAVVAYGSKLYWLLPGRDGFMEGKLMTCDLPACATPTAQAGALDSPSGLLVDASGAWWFTKGAKIQTCAPNGCAGGQKDVAGPLDGPHDLLADDAFIYWAEKTKVMKLAK